MEFKAGLPNPPPRPPPACGDGRGPQPPHTSASPPARGGCSRPVPALLGRHMLGASCPRSQFPRRTLARRLPTTRRVLTRRRERARCPTPLILSGRGPQGLLPTGIAAARSATLGFDVDVLAATHPCKPEGRARSLPLPGSHPPSRLLSLSALHSSFPRCHSSLFLIEKSMYANDQTRRGCYGEVSLKTTPPSTRHLLGCWTHLSRANKQGHPFLVCVCGDGLSPHARVYVCP